MATGGIGGIISGFFQGYRTPVGTDPDAIFPYLQMLVQLDEAEQRMQDSAYGTWGEVNKALAAAQGDIISAQAEMAAAGAEVSAAQVEALGALGADIAKLNEIAPGPSEGQVGAASTAALEFGRGLMLDQTQQQVIREAAASQGVQLAGATTDQIVGAIIGNRDIASLGLTAPEGYQAAYAAQGDDAMDKTVFANEARAQAAARLIGAEGQSPLATWEQALELPAGTINNQDVAFGLVNRVYGQVDNEVYDTGSAVNQEANARSQRALEAIQDIKDDIDSKGVATNTPIMQSAIEHLNRMSAILQDPDGKANEIIMKNVDTTGIDKTREFVNARITELQEYQDPYSKAVADMFSVHEGAPAVIGQLFGDSFFDIDRAARWVISDPQQFSMALEAYDDAASMRGDGGAPSKRQLNDALRDYQVSAPGVSSMPSGYTETGRTALERIVLDGGEAGASPRDRLRAQKAEKILGVGAPVGAEEAMEEAPPGAAESPVQEAPLSLAQRAQARRQRLERAFGIAEPAADVPEAVMEGADESERLPDAPIRFMDDATSSFIEQSEEAGTNKQAVDLLKQQFGIEATAGQAREGELFSGGSEYIPPDNAKARRDTARNQQITRRMRELEGQMADMDRLEAEQALKNQDQERRRKRAKEFAESDQMSELQQRAKALRHRRDLMGGVPNLPE